MGDWQLLGVVETIFGCLCVMAWFFFFFFIVFSIFCMKSFGVCARPNVPCRNQYVSGKLPTYPSPKLTLTLTSHLGQNVGLGER